VRQTALKSWLESVRDRPSAAAHRRLARSNAHTAVPIETVDGVESADDGEPWSLDERFLQEAHHDETAVRGSWSGTSPTSTTWWEFARAADMAS
jgi:hypothetical protein